MIFICSFVLIGFGCQNEREKIAEESISDYSESSIEDIVMSSEGTIEGSSTEIFEETSENPIKYATLTEENFEEVLIMFMSISGAEDLWKLDYLPLTEELKKELSNDFPYEAEIANFEWLRVEAWGVNDEGLACVFRVNKEQGVSFDYYIVMQLEEGKIAEVELIRLAK